MINKNKDLMDGSKSSQPTGQMRGRLVDNLKQIEKHIDLKPGQISEKLRFVLFLSFFLRHFSADPLVFICTYCILREALGVKENELPPYIDRMWVHGYPPGYQKLKA